MQSAIMSVSSPQVQDELREFRDRVATCYGPFGRVALLQPIPGGHVTITSQSSQIFQLFKTSNLVLQVLLTSLQSHINNYYKGGKMAAILTTNIILNCLDLECPRRQISDVIDHLLTKASSYIRSKCCIELDWSSVTCLMNVVKTLLSSHPLCTLGKDELNHTASLILQSFLHVIPTTSLSSQLSVHDRIHIYCFSECSLPVSTLFKGLLLEEQHASCINRDIELCLSDHCFKHNSQGLIITAVYDISLAGDQEDGYTNVIVMESSNVSTKVLQEEASCEQLLILGAALIKRNIGVVICQKCVHPCLRKLLEKEGIVVLERLGLTYINAVIDMTGGHVISSLTLPDQLGALTNIAMVTIGSKKYIHLEGIVPHASLTLPYLLEIVGDELKSLVITTIRCLEDLLYSPQVVNGGGCMFTKLAHYISSQQASDNIMSHELHCNQRTFGEVCNAVSTSFHQTAAALQYNTNCLTLTDTATYHCWVFPSYDVCLSLSSTSFGQSKSCVCGSIKLSDLPNDSSWVSVSGWKRQESVIPDIVEDVLKANSSHCSHPLISFPVLCDPLRQTLASISLSKQLAVMITRTAGVLLNED